MVCPRVWAMAVDLKGEHVEGVEAVCAEADAARGAATRKWMSGLS